METLILILGCAILKHILYLKQLTRSFFFFSSVGVWESQRGDNTFRILRMRKFYLTGIEMYTEELFFWEQNTGIKFCHWRCKHRLDKRRGKKKKEGDRCNWKTNPTKICYYSLLVTLFEIFLLSDLVRLKKLVLNNNDDWLQSNSTFLKKLNVK